MRVLKAGALARVILIFVILVGNIIGNAALNPPSSGTPSPDVAEAKGNGATHEKARNPRKPSGKARGAGKRDAGKGKQSGKNKGKKNGKKAPAALDKEKIEAENASAVEAFQCDELDKLRVGDRTYCSHGNDPQLFGTTSESAADAPLQGTTTGGSPQRALCIDDGQSGPRVELVYVHRNDRPDRLPQLLPTFRRLASEMDVIVDQSARKTGASLRIRFATNNQCQVEISSLGVPANAIDGFGSSVGKLAEAGFNKIDRKYLMLVDASVFCGVGTFAYDDVPTTDAHNFTGYARIDAPCWDPGSMLHELSHTLGAVQYSAPHTSRGAHCIDEWDVMCYRDEPHKPKMKFLCTDGAQDFRLDCGNDDYFAAQPTPGSYLTRRWNMANSIYLAAGNGDVCPDAAEEPDDAYWYDFWKVPMRELPVGQSQERAFCSEPGDTDWVLFTGKRGTSYQVQTRNLGPEVDTQLIAYRGFKEQKWAGMDKLGVNDDRTEGDSSSSIIFTALSDGSYLIGVSEAGNRAGLDKTYTLSIEEAPTTLSARALALSRAKAKPGGAFSATIGGVTPGATVTFWWRQGDAATEIGESDADASGSAAATWVVPKGARKGSSQIEAIGSDGTYATAVFKVDEKGGKDNKGGPKKRKNSGQHKGKDGHRKK